MKNTNTTEQTGQRENAVYCADCGMELDNAALSEMIKDMQAQLKDKVRIETAVNIISGEGKEHMALLSALLRLGVGIRFVAFTKEGIREI